MSHLYTAQAFVDKHPSFVNTEADELVANIRSAVQSGYPLVGELPAKEQPIAIVGGGPSVNLWHLKLFHRDQRHHIMALGGMGQHLHSKGLTPDSLVILDARPFNARFLDDLPSTVTLYLASQCAREVYEKAARFDTVLVWHAAHPCMAGGEMTASDLMVPKWIDPAVLGMSVPVIGGGTTVGMLAIPLAGCLGWRTMALHGFDSSYADGKAHPYPQPENEGEDTLEIEFPLFSGKKYVTSQWMATQAAKFERVSQAVIQRYGATIEVHGTGLLPAFARAMAEGDPVAHQYARDVDTAEGIADLNERAVELLGRIGQDAYGVEVGIYQGETSKRLLRGNETLKLVMVDSWGNYDGNPSDFHSKLLPEEQAESIKHTLNNVSFAGDRATIVRMKSVDAARMFPDSTFDFVFLDADHRYEGVAADIKAWWPKVRPGGWLGGHDYGKPEFGVTSAVNQFCGVNHVIPDKYDLQLGAESTWFVVKDSASTKPALRVAGS